MRIYKAEMEKASKQKEFFYVGVAHDPETGKRIVKFGTTNNLARRRREHQRKKDYKEFPLQDFEYLTSLKLSHANTIRLEDGVRNALQSVQNSDELFVRNDRYILNHDESVKLEVKVLKKTYEIVIPGA